MKCNTNIFRKCPKHKVEFSHPKDSDYDTDPDDTRIACIYGASCYRKSKTHRKQYKHPTPRYFRKRKLITEIILFMYTATQKFPVNVFSTNHFNFHYL